MPSLAAMLLLVASMAMTGANVPLGKAIVTDMPVTVYLVFRFAVASAALALIAGREPGRPLRDLTSHEWCGIAVLGIVGSVLFTYFVMEGVARTSGADAGIITATLPAVVVLIGLALGERPTAGQLAMIALAVAGVALVQVTAAPGGSSSALGNLLVGLAVLCEAAFVVVARRIAGGIGPIRLSLAVALVSLAVCLPFGLPALAAFDPARVGLGIWALATWHALAASALCTILWYRGAPHVEPWAAGLATAAVPVAALATAVLFLGETIDAVRLAGAVLVILAIAAGTSGQRRCGS